MDLIDLYDSLIGYGPLINRTQSGIHKGRLLASFLDPDYLDVFTMLTLMRLFDTELAVHQLSIIDFLDETPITKEDKDRALKIVADNFKRIDFEEFRTCTLTAYIMTLLFGVIAKGISDNKNFYFENNNETQYNELEWIIASNDELQAKVKQLQSDLSYQEEYVRILKSQIKDLESNASKNVQGTVQDLNKEIMLLESKINALQDELLVERRKNIELNRLREFVFSIQAGDDIAIPKEKLKDLAGSKKIYIFGGHINWRNKMKRQYPFLTILDGHRESFDERILFNADLVLLNTSNMSHALYYKVIDILRTNDISFDYIGKYKNTDLLEGEIAEILLRRKE